MPDNDIFECIRCGNSVYHAANYCPHCGLDLYPEPETADATTAGTGTRRGRGALWSGLALIVLLALAYPMLAPVVPAPVILLLIGGVLLALLGGLIFRRVRQRARERAAFRRFLDGFEE
jgi:hypothetical protein